MSMQWAERIFMAFALLICLGVPIGIMILALRSGSQW